MDNNSYIAFFDLDRTITRVVSGRALAWGAYYKGLMNRTDMVKALFLSLSYKMKLMDPVKVIGKMITWVKGLPVKTLDNLCAEVFRDVMLPSVYSEMVQEIEMHRKNRARTVILSSALSQICRDVASHLSMNDYICTEMEVDNGYLTGRTLGALCYGEEKKKRLIMYCEKNNTLPADSWYYADSISDLPVLEAVGHPVCVNPDRELMKRAKAGNWKIYDL